MLNLKLNVATDTKSVCGEVTDYRLRIAALSLNQPASVADGSNEFTDVI